MPSILVGLTVVNLTLFSAEPVAIRQNKLERLCPTFFSVELTTYKTYRLGSSKLLDLFKSSRLGWKYLSGTNAQAYLKHRKSLCGIDTRSQCHKTFLCVYKFLYQARVFVPDKPF